MELDKPSLNPYKGGYFKCCWDKRGISLTQLIEELQLYQLGYSIRMNPMQPQMTTLQLRTKEALAALMPNKGEQFVSLCVEDFGLGATLQGHVTSIDFLTDQTYDVHSYRPIFISAMAWVKASQLPDVMTRVFTDPTRTEDQDFPIATDFSSACFRNFFNDVFATQEYLIVDEEFQGSQAVIPPMIQTMEVVGGDELELSYDDYIYLLTGYYPKNNKSQLLGFRTTRGKMFAPTMLMPQDAGKPVVGAKFSARHTYSSNKNMIAIEPSFLIAIAGVIAEPNSDAVYGTSRQPIPVKQVSILEQSVVGVMPKVCLPRC